MKQRTKILITTAIIFSALSGVTFAKNHPNKHHCPEGMPIHKGFEHVLNDLNLSEQQKHEIAEIRAEDHNKPSDKFKERRNFHRTLMKASQNNASDKELRQLISAHHAEHTEAMISHLNVHKKIMGVLTPDQKELLEQRREARFEKMNSKMKHH